MSQGYRGGHDGYGRHDHQRYDNHQNMAQHRQEDDYPGSSGSRQSSGAAVDRDSVNRIVENIRMKCQQRGPKGVKDLGRTFRLYDTDRSFSLTEQELCIGLRRYGLDISDHDVKLLMRAFNRDNDATISVDEFFRAIRPPMNEGRMKMVEMAFKKMDRTGDGVITCEDLSKTYDAKDHPKYKSGEYTANQCFKEFLGSFETEDATRDGRVTFQEFVDYYAGVSSNIDRDIYFDYMMRRTWKL